MGAYLRSSLGGVVVKSLVLSLVGTNFYLGTGILNAVKPPVLKLVGTEFISRNLPHFVVLKLSP